MSTTEPSRRMNTTERPVGVLLVNLGTPEAPRTAEVRRYLREFLSDPRVIDIPWFFRALILYAFILPFRPAKSAEAYAKIWTTEGSPLLVHGRNLVHKVATDLGEGYCVRLAMRYGAPSIAGAIEELVREGVKEIVVLPLYPQYASSSTGSTVEEVCRVIGQMWNTPPITVLGSFFDHPDFINAFVQVGKENFTQHGRPEHVLMSFHGLPERQIKKSDPRGLGCLRGQSCCEDPGERLQYCYRAQCFATAKALASGLGLSEQEYTVCFQSRLGRTPWVKPYTDELVPLLAARGVKDVAVFCPAFVADCLETVEEIGMRAADSFSSASAGAGRLRLVPSLNDSDLWAAGVANLIRKRQGVRS